MKRYENCVYSDLPREKAEEFIRNSEARNLKLRYEARVAKSGKLDYVDIWSYLKNGETP
jgi:hypothetical protein